MTWEQVRILKRNMYWGTLFKGIVWTVRGLSVQHSTVLILFRTPERVESDYMERIYDDNWIFVKVENGGSNT